jgi:hypothetical protein
MFATKDVIAVPYLMLQVRMESNREVKLVFVGGQFQYFMSCPKKTRVYQSFTDFTSDELVSFATTAIQCISAHEQYIIDGVVRVDIFTNNEGNLVVNDFESLEARIFTSSSTKLCACTQLLHIYWEKKIYTCLKSLK